MYFDRFDICAAWYTYAALHHSGQESKEYKIFGRLEKIGYKHKGYFLTTENAKDIYNNLCITKGANIRG